MKLLITGAGGQLGREWMQFLGSSSHHGFGFGSEDLDITNEKQVRQIIQDIKPDVVINCAAYTAVEDAEKNREKAFNVNQAGVANVARICKYSGIKLVHFSTDYVFEGSEKDKIDLPLGYPEEHPANPQNVYGASKLAGEQEIEQIGGDWMIIRVAWLCGQFGNNFVKTMLRFSDQKKDLRVVNDQTGSPTFCTDLVEKTMGLIDLKQKGYFHLSSDGKITWYELTEELLKQCGNSETVKLIPVSSAEFAANVKRPAFSLLNCSKIKDLGLPSIDWKDGLRVLLNQIHQNELKE